MKKFLVFMTLISLFFNSCSSVRVAGNDSIPAIKLQEYDYTKLDLKDLLEKIQQMSTKLQKMDLSGGLDEKTMNELYEVDRQYKAFKALKFDKEKAEFALQPKSKTTFDFKTYCLNSGKASPSGKEQFTLQKESPDIALYKEILLYTNTETKAEQRLKQSLLWNLRNEVMFENLPVEQQAFLLKMDPKSLLKVNSMLKKKIKKQLKDIAKSQIPYYKETSDAVNFAKGKVYTYQQYENRVRSLISKYKLPDNKNPIAANGYNVSTLTSHNGYSNAAITFINTSDAILYISCISYFAPFRKDVQQIGFDIPLIFFDIGIYGPEIEKAYEELNKYIQARDRDLKYAQGNDFSYCNLYVYRELAKRYGIMLPMAEGSKWTMTANQMYDYFSNSNSFEMISRLPDGTLDHATAQRLAAQGNTVLADYKNPGGGEGHVVFVTGNELSGGKVIVDGYNTTSGKIGLTDNFSSQFSSTRIPTTNFFVIR